MKKNLTYLTLLSSSFLLIACGGATSDNKSTENKAVLGVTKTTTIMQKNILYTMAKGKSIVPISSTPNIVLYTNVETGKTTAKLLKGEAKIIALN